MNSTYPMVTTEEIADLQGNLPFCNVLENTPTYRTMVVEEVDDLCDNPSLCNTAPSDGSLLEGPSFPPSLSHFGKGPCVIIYNVNII